MNKRIAKGFPKGSHDPLRARVAGQFGLEPAMGDLQEFSDTRGQFL